MNRRSFFQIIAGALTAAGQALGWIKKAVKRDPICGYTYNYGGTYWASFFDSKRVRYDGPVCEDPATRNSILNDPAWGEPYVPSGFQPASMQYRHVDPCLGAMGRGGSHELVPHPNPERFPRFRPYPSSEPDTRCWPPSRRMQS